MSDKHDFWEGHLKAWRASGQTQSRYCREHHLSLASFGYWRRKLKASQGSAATGMIPIVPAGACAPTPVEIVLRNGLTVRVPMTAEPSRIAAWVQGLGTC